MQYSVYHIHTVETLDGPWYVTGGVKHWIIINVLTRKTKTIGPVRMKGTNYHDRACLEAQRRNALFLKEHRLELPLHLGKFEAFDKTIIRVLKEEP